MALEMTVTTKGASINNAYLKITRMRMVSEPNLNGSPTTLFAGHVQIGVFANKTLADTHPGNAIAHLAEVIPNFTAITGSGNVMANIYTYLLTLPQFAGATSV